MCPFSEPPLPLFQAAGNPINVDSEDSDQTGRMPSLIWVFARRTGHFVGFVMLRLFLIFWNSLTFFEEEKTFLPTDLSLFDRVG